ncbi:MAG TPA: protein phosphatase 2C domain-containing protein, partial [Ktedonobacterales bacterium]|nr:protein phosphatase 2C domain-containing protein [Ktedonobacterales bacterium]
NNEDYLGYLLPYTPEQLRSHGCVFVLADGVGGQQKGEVASQLAIETVLDGFSHAKSGEPHKTLLARVIQAANLQVYEEGSASLANAGMATTIVACALRADRAVIAHVGDSRCYLVRDGRAKTITRDHTIAAEQIRLGVMSAPEAAESPNRHLLSRSVGNDMMVNVEIDEIQVQKGDLFLQCSDGLHASVFPEDIASVVARNDSLHAAAEKLVAMANERDGSDNVSVQLIRIHDVERTGMYRGRPYNLR